jgi:hypothetical protein
MTAITSEFIKKAASLSEEKQKEVVRLVEFAFEEGAAIKRQYGLDREPPVGAA